jgi:VIT1/CCC1 family predicted Fe2+/Mn2+ transporter
MLKKAPDIKTSPLSRLRASLAASAGEVVFGMEDGTVSIFGLVFGVAATTNDNAAVLIAGASGAVAAAVSMMAGTYLDLETSHDEALTAVAAIDAEMQHDAEAVAESVLGQLRLTGMSADESEKAARFLRAEPGILKSIASAFAAPSAPGVAQSPIVRSLWMLIADFLAAAIPIVPFVVMPVPEGRVVSAAVTLLLLIGLGVGRARIARRLVLRTVIETVSIGVAAAFAGVGIGVLIARLSGA